MDFKTLRTVKLIDLKIPGLRIISKIGEGGMSVVYLAEQKSLNREVAVKVMKLEISNNDLDVQRFKHEAKTIAHLDHPNIINIYNIGQTSKGEIFFTMPYLNHGDFSNYILEDEQEFILLLKSICEGLGYAHDRGIVHRDIKPENLLFDKFGNVRIADFGIAISKDGTRMTKEHQIVGSAQYMSPEQARSLKVDVHTDIYSLGIVIYERLTGRVPFDSDESISILVNHVSMEPPKLPPKMRHWQPLIDKCLAKSADDRYQSMGELKVALDKVPVNGLQRTNSSIKSALAHDIGKHLRWFAPSLIILLFVAAYLYNNKQDATNFNTVKVVESIKHDSLKEPREVADKSEEYTQKEPSKNSGPELKSQNVVGLDKITVGGFENNTDKTYTVQENTVRSNNTRLEIEQLLIKAFQNIDDYQLSKPADNNASDQLLSVLLLDPKNTKALNGIDNIKEKYLNLIKSSIKKLDFNAALRHARSLKVFNQKTKKLNISNNNYFTSILQTIKKTDISSNTISAEQVRTLSRIVKVFSPNHELLKVLMSQASSKLMPKIGDVLLDEMGVEVILINNSLAASIHEVTIENYTEFTSETNRVPAKCKHKGGMVSSFFNTKTWDKPYFDQTIDHPVVCVSYDDASAYAEWLSSKTENRYRIPTKKEWLLLATVEKNTFEACKTANVTGSEAIKLRNKEDKYSCNDQYKNTAPVASFAQNKLGLFDIQGNVSEWINCDSSPCKKPQVMGSSWYSGKQSNLLQFTENLKPATGYSYVGFRLVRDL